MFFVREDLPLGRDHHGAAAGSPGHEPTASAMSEECRTPVQRSEEGKPSPSRGTPNPEQSSVVSIEEFQRIALRVGVVLSAEDHPNADRLLVLKVDLGEGAPRQLVAGIKGPYHASALVGKQVVVAANLKPATIRGVESQGMVLAAQDSSRLSLLIPDHPIQAGSVVK